MRGTGLRSRVAAPGRTPGGYGCRARPSRESTSMKALVHASSRKNRTGVCAAVNAEQPDEQQQAAGRGVVLTVAYPFRGGRLTAQEPIDIAKPSCHRKTFPTGRLTPFVRAVYSSGCVRSAHRCVCLTIAPLGTRLAAGRRTGVCAIGADRRG